MAPVPGWSPASVEADALPPGASAFVPVEPCRLADTRQTEPGATPLGGDTWRVAVAGRCGVPLNASAVAITLTAAGTTGPGFMTVVPAGSPRAETSNVNWAAAGAVRANASITMLRDGLLWPQGIPSGSWTMCTSTTTVHKRWPTSSSATWYRRRTEGPRVRSSERGRK